MCHWPPRIPSYYKPFMWSIRDSILVTRGKKFLHANLLFIPVKGVVKMQPHPMPYQSISSKHPPPLRSKLLVSMFCIPLPS